MGGPREDGGVDMVLRKDAETWLVQCKQWKSYKVDVTVVRELYGVMAARGASGGFVITSGSFTSAAIEFAEGRNMRLIDGPKLFGLIQQGQTAGTARTASVTPAPSTSHPVQATVQDVPSCPVCSSAMVRRTAKKGANAGSQFWGCSTYPLVGGRGHHMATSETARLAVLIDADNAQRLCQRRTVGGSGAVWKGEHQARYGDWTCHHLKGWKEVLHKLAIQPMQQFTYTSGKNATDSALIIDAMDILHAGGLDVLPDLVRQRLREACHAYQEGGSGGVWLRRTQDACCVHRSLRQVHLRRDIARKVRTAKGRGLSRSCCRAAEVEADDAEGPGGHGARDGWASLSAVGSQLTLIIPHSTPGTTKRRSLANWFASRAILR